MTANLNDSERAAQAPLPKKKPSAVDDALTRLGVMGEILSFFWKRRLFWLIPMLIVLGLIAIFIIIGISSPAGAFIYTLF
ncbi:DUF5989 family protein [Aggregatilineales bacterium SYSU G02658]